MSLLYKTISSFFPTEAHCTFVDEPWFIANYDLQLNVLRLCQMGLACVLFSKIKDYQIFKMHVMCCVRRYIDPDYCMDSPVYRANFTEYLISSISNGDYLLTRKWFCNETYRHVDVYLIELNGCSNLINVLSGDFDEHINSIKNTIVRKNSYHIMCQKW